MTGEPGVSTSPTQLSTQRRVCVVGLAQGFRCLPVLPGTEHCAKHHPDQAERRSEQASVAARRSHAARLAPLKLPLECMSPDFSTPVARIRYRELVAGARAQGQCDDKAAGTLLSAVDGAMKDQDKPPKPRRALPGLRYPEPAA